LTDKVCGVILVVDDDAMNREVMEAFLSAEDYCVLLANSGEQALKLLTETTPDLVILDVRMPDMDGYQVCEAITRSYTIPVIIVSGYSEPEDAKRGMAAGAVDYIARPFNADNFLERVHRWTK